MAGSNTPHLVGSKYELQARGWQQLDVVLITGDANVDHPSFGANLLGRLLEKAGYRIGLLARPQQAQAVAELGAPRLFFGVSSGSLDSMVANYTALRKKRRSDPFAPAGESSRRPDRALIVYCQYIRQVFAKQVFVIAGGIEASLRRFAHYDYQSDRIRRPILMDCPADVLVYGMGEKPLLQIAQILDGEDLFARPQRDKISALSKIPQLVFRLPKSAPAPSGVQLPSMEEIEHDRAKLGQAFVKQERNPTKRMMQAVAGMRVIANPNADPLSTGELDSFYDLPFTRDVHPIHQGRTVPALEQVRFSVTSHRGCFGGCAFCAISAHQGKFIQSRSQASILAEVRRISEHPQFRGTLADIGGPTANMYGFSCKQQKLDCKRPSCLWPKRCNLLSGDQQRYLDVLRKAKNVPNIKHLFVTTGIRFDLALVCPAFLKELITQHTSGHLKVAPEHTVAHVLHAMRKPKEPSFETFLSTFRQISTQSKPKRFVLPYLMAAHPGSRLQDMIEVACFLRKNKIRVEQVQIFTPTPHTLATTMYATGIDPVSDQPIFVERNEGAKRMQKALLLSHLKENQTLVKKALAICRRLDLLSLLSP